MSIQIRPKNFGSLGFQGFCIDQKDFGSLRIAVPSPPMVKWRGVWNGYTLTRFFLAKQKAERMRRILPNLGGQVQSHDVFKCTSTRTCTFLMVSPMLTTPQNSLLCQSGCMSPIKIA